MVMETLGCCIKNIETKSKVVSMVDQIKENILSYSLPVSLLTAACNTVYIGLEYLDKDTLQQTCFDFFAPIMDVSFTMKILNKIKKEIFYFFQSGHSKDTVIYLIYYVPKIHLFKSAI